jgi:hypothetical protein
MKNYFKNISIQKFTLIAILLSLSADATIISYVYLTFTDPAVFDGALKIVFEAMPNAKSSMPPDYMTQLLYVFKTSLILALGGMAIFHILIYLLWYNQKNLAIAYMKFYAHFAAPGLIIGSLFMILDSPLWSLLLAISGLLYVYIVLGFRNLVEKI